MTGNMFTKFIYLKVIAQYSEYSKICPIYIILDVLYTHAFHSFEFVTLEISKQRFSLKCLSITCWIFQASTDNKLKEQVLRRDIFSEEEICNRMSQ